MSGASWSSVSISAPWVHRQRWLGSWHSRLAVIAPTRVRQYGSATFASGIRHWLRFLSERGSWAGRIESLSQVDRALVSEFIAWLDRPPHRVGTRYSRWSTFKQLLAWLQHHRPELVHPELGSHSTPFHARTPRRVRAWRYPGRSSMRCWPRACGILSLAGRPSVKAKRLLPR